MKNGKNIRMFSKREKSKYGILKNFFINLIALTITAFFLFNFFKSNYAINRSDSITAGIYKLYPLDNNIKKGDTVVFNVSDELFNYMLDRGYIDKYTKSFIKIVAGVPEDEIEIGKDLKINGKIIKENLYKKDSLGRDLPLKEGKYTLKKDEYFVIGTHIRSFDSSYMGVIRKEQIKNKAKLEVEF